MCSPPFTRYGKGKEREARGDRERGALCVDRVLPHLNPSEPDSLALSVSQLAAYGSSEESSEQNNRSRPDWN